MHSFTPSQASMPISIDDRLAVKSSNYRERQSAGPSPPAPPSSRPSISSLRYEFRARERKREKKRL